MRIFATLDVISRTDDDLSRRKPALDASDACYSCSERVEALRLLLNHPNISLFTLNASDPQGATPLGAAAGMNLLEIVQSLLADSSGAVSVDGIDSCGATALMREYFHDLLRVGNTETWRFRCLLCRECGSCENSGEKLSSGIVYRHKLIRVSSLRS